MTGDSMSDARKILQKYWGYPDFREGQKQIIQASLDGRDLLALLPTGGGKSVCYQVPGLLTGGLTLVISPLIALMDDQVEQLVSKGIRAYRIHSGMTRRQIGEVLDNCINGPIHFLYISPERLSSSRFQASLPHLPVTQIAVDEAHCISQWGHDFRPAYQQISLVRDIFPSIPMRAFTATATQRVRDDIVRSLALKDPFLYYGEIYRSNLTLQIYRSEDRIQDILEYCNRHKGQCGIMYVRNRRSCMEIAQSLLARGIRATAYHAGLLVEKRERAMLDWLREDVHVIVATNAFGMGIDKANVRFVLHVEAPPDLESYYQEAGRAGRDGLDSEAILFLQRGDRKKAYENWKAQYVDESVAQKVYKQLAISSQVAVGELPEELFDLNIQQVAKETGIFYTECFHAIRLLQLGGWIEWVEGPGQGRSMVQILAEVHELSFLKDQEEWRMELINGLLRLYEAVLSMPVVIDESDLSKHLQWTPKEIVIRLRQLDQEDVVTYTPGTSFTRFRFVTPRIRSEQLRFAGTKIDMIRKWQEKKLQYIWEYISEQRCLYQKISQYFDLSSDKNCGHCSYCIKQSQRYSQEDLTNMIAAHLKKSGLDLIELQACIPANYDAEVLLKTLEYLLDEEMVVLIDQKYHWADEE